MQSSEFSQTLKNVFKSTSRQNATRPPYPWVTYNGSYQLALLFFFLIRIKCLTREILHSFCTPKQIFLSCSRCQIDHMTKRRSDERGHHRIIIHRYGCFTPFFFKINWDKNFRPINSHFCSCKYVFLMQSNNKKVIIFFTNNKGNN